MQIASITTNEQGEYEYATEEDYLEQTLDIIIQKEGYERKNISYEIDKAEIKSDILLNELEKGTKEKTRIFGTIRNSKNRDPVKAASIKLSIEGTQIASVSSNEQGEYEYTADEDYTGQTLDFIIQKEGFIKKNISFEIDKLEIKSDILIDKIEIEIKGKICDKADRPLADGNISFRMGDKTIKLISDKDGSFSLTVGQQFLNQSIGYEVSKEGFKVKSGKLELIEDLKCINLDPINPIPPIKVATVLIVLSGLAILLFALPVLMDIILPDESPELAIDPDPLNFDFVPGTSAQTFSIWNDGDGTLEWDVYSDRDWIVVSHDSGTGSGTVSVSVNSAGMDPRSHTGTITVESNGGIETGRVSLYVPVEEPTEEPTLEPPRIHYFNADPKHIDGLEGETTLSWEVTGATSVTIDGVGPVEVSEGAIDRWVEQTTTFILRATNDAGVPDIRATTVYVGEELVDPPVIHYFSAVPNHIDGLEGETTLSWEVSGATSVTIDGVGPVEVSEGSIDRWVEQTTTFVLRATKDAEISDVRTVIVTVEDETADLPIIHYFVADPAGISAGERSTLRWEVSGATSIAIDGIGKVDPTGEIIVDTDETTIYFLRATNEAGKNVETVTVNVGELPPILSVDPDPPSFDFELKTVLNFRGANTRTFSVDNSGGGDLFWTIETTKDWITIEPTRGYNSETITLKIITTGLEPDEYEGNIYIKSNYGTSRGYISLILVDGSMSAIERPSDPIIIR